MDVPVWVKYMRWHPSFGLFQVLPQPREDLNRCYNSSINMKFATLLGLSTATLALGADRRLRRPRAAGPDQAQVHLGGFSHSGTGCAPGFLSVTEDYNQLMLTFQSYFAKDDLTTAISQVQKDCEFNVYLMYPGGWQYAVRSISICDPYSYRYDNFNLSYDTTYSFPTGSNQHQTVRKLPQPPRMEI
jgi:hypothetical protein